MTSMTSMLFNFSNARQVRSRSCPLQNEGPTLGVIQKHSDCDVGRSWVQSMSIDFRSQVRSQKPRPGFTETHTDRQERDGASLETLWTSWLLIFFNPMVSGQLTLRILATLLSKTVRLRFTQPLKTVVGFIKINKHWPYEAYMYCTW